MTIVPIAERRSRLPVAGRVRLGIKVPFTNSRGERKMKPVALDTFRFTSRHGDDITKLAEMYGGEPKPWKDSKSEDRFEVITTSSEIRVALPPDPLGDSFYEMFGGKGMERQCDGVTCSITVSGPHGPEPASCPCLCRERGVKECKPKLRLAVLLPEIKLRGVWRMDTSSEAALDELPGMVATLQHLQGEGLTEGLLRLEKRQSQGGRQHFVVPALGIAESLEGLIAGRARLAALPSPAGGGGSPSGSVLPLPSADSPDLPVEGWCPNCGVPRSLDEAGGDRLYWEYQRCPSCGVNKPLVAEEPVVDAELLEEDDPALEPSPREKARMLRVIRSQAILEGIEPPDTWEEAVRAGLT